ncbi:hypothetical protein [Staphylococcus auricularis]|uniref:hypothetical protein n=1 Tax=Staphylococcus auricularis TaxID=29379 RepID=UPI003F78DA1A
MDCKYDAIKMMSKLKLSALDVDYHDIKNGDEEVPNNPLENVLFEILNTEIVIPTLQVVESQIGESDISFCAFVSSSKNDSVELVFSRPCMSIESNLGNDIIAKEVINMYQKEKKRLVK